MHIFNLNIVPTTIQVNIKSTIAFISIGAASEGTPLFTLLGV